MFSFALRIKALANNATVTCPFSEQTPAQLIRALKARSEMCCVEVVRIEDDVTAELSPDDIAFLIAENRHGGPEQCIVPYLLAMWGARVAQRKADEESDKNRLRKQTLPYDPTLPALITFCGRQPNSGAQLA